MLELMLTDVFLVTTLLWPTTSRAGFEAASRALAQAQAQHRLYTGYREAMAGLTPRPGIPRDPPAQTRSGQDPRAIAIQQDQALAEFGATLDAALTDSYEVSNLCRPWRPIEGFPKW